MNNVVIFVHIPTNSGNILHVNTATDNDLWEEAGSITDRDVHFYIYLFLPAFCYELCGNGTKQYLQ